jgi:predicted dehydrogenase
MLNVGVIGLSMGQDHLLKYSSIKGVKIYAISDLDEERLSISSEKYNVPYKFKDFHKLLDTKGIDAVSICLPNFLHATVTIEALDKGKHVLVEKPMAMNSKEAEEMVNKAKHKKKLLAVAMNYRFTPERMFLKTLIDKGEFGKIYYVKCVTLRRKTFDKKIVQSKDSKKWFFTKERSGGGALVDMGPHLLDLAMWYLDDFNPISAYGVASTELMTYSDIDDFSSSIIKLKGGSTLHLESTWESWTEPKLYNLLLGTKGGAKTDPLVIYKDVDGTNVEIRPQVQQNELMKDKTLQTHFVDCIKKNKTPEVSGERGLAVMKIIDAVYKSSKTGKAVTI